MTRAARQFALLCKYMCELAFCCISTECVYCMCVIMGFFLLLGHLLHVPLSLNLPRWQIVPVGVRPRPFGERHLRRTHRQPVRPADPAFVPGAVLLRTPPVGLSLSRAEEDQRGRPLLPPSDQPPELLLHPGRSAELKQGSILSSEDHKGAQVVDFCCRGKGKKTLLKLFSFLCILKLKHPMSFSFLTNDPRRTGRELMLPSFSLT